MISAYKLHNYTPTATACNIYAVQQDTQSVSMSEFIQHMFRPSPVHHQERFVQAVFADLVTK